MGASSTVNRIGETFLDTRVLDYKEEDLFIGMVVVIKRNSGELLTMARYISSLGEEYSEVGYTSVLSIYQDYESIIYLSVEKYLEGSRKGRMIEEHKRVLGFNCYFFYR